MRYLYRLLKLSGVLICLMLLGYTLFLSVRRISRGVEERVIVPKKTSINLSHSGKDYSFLTTRDVLGLLPFNVNDTVEREVSTHEVEKILLDKSPYIAKVSAYISPWGKTMNINITERCPIVRYYFGGQSYYVDDEGELFSNRAGASAHVPLVTGVLSSDTASDLLYDLGLYFRENKEWKEFIGAVYIVSSHEIWLYPRVGDYIFVIGDLDDMDEKLAKIPIFYKSILPKVGVEKYRVINLSYTDQIVCKKRRP